MECSAAVASCFWVAGSAALFPALDLVPYLDAINVCNYSMSISFYLILYSIIISISINVQRRVCFKADKSSSEKVAPCMYCLLLNIVNISK